MIAPRQRGLHAPEFFLLYFCEEPATTALVLQELPHTDLISDLCGGQFGNGRAEGIGKGAIAMLTCARRSNLQIRISSATCPTSSLSNSRSSSLILGGNFTAW